MHERQNDCRDVRTLCETNSRHACKGWTLHLRAVLQTGGHKVNDQFMLAITKGAYIKVAQNNRTHDAQIRRVSKVTDTQIVVEWEGYNEAYTDRFVRKDGSERTSASWYYRKCILPVVVTLEEIANYEAVQAANKAFRLRRAEVKIQEESCRVRIARRLNCAEFTGTFGVSAGKVKVEARSNDGFVTYTFEVKIEGLTADEVAAL